MKKFLINIVIFLLALTTLTTLLVIVTAYFTRQTFDFEISKAKNVLVLGNSHPECAINDSYLPNAYNVAQGGSGYFYDYLKLREIYKHNPHIDTVVIGYSYGDLAKGMDSWFSGKDKIKYKIQNHFFLFNGNDYISVLKANPTQVLLNTPQTIFHNIKMKYKGYPYLGGFKPLENKRLRKDKELIGEHKPDVGLGVSKYQSKYLLKIYEFCISKKIKLILLNTPIHPMLENVQSPLKPNYYNFASQKLPSALLINHSNFKLPESSYRDLSHIHRDGAKAYSEFLKSNKFKSSLQSFPSK